MSHDIRTPMNAIIGFTALLDRMIEVDSELGKGTTITITVEFSIAKNEKSADSNKKNTVKQKTAEEEFCLQKTMTLMLRLQLHC